MTTSKEFVEDKDKQDLRDRARIVKFFLELFKIEIDALQTSPTEFSPLEKQAYTSNFTYELRVRHMGEWESRRMSVGRLGEESGSKSKCFYVIYDDHLVVKIPPSPIKSFQSYLDSIKADQHIMGKVAPRECVVPGVSVILKRVHQFIDGPDLSPEELEVKYIKWLSFNPEYQEHLKINNNFVFFMDLSKHSILGDVIDKLHGDKNKEMCKEIMDNPGLIWEPDGFEGRYGHDNASVCFDIHEVYMGFETRVRRLLIQSGASPSVLPYEIQKWFLTHLAGKEVSKDEKDLNSECIDELNDLLREIVKENHHTVEDYRKTIKQYTYQTGFSINKSRMGGIISNILDLLAWLREKKVALRDLKPDNILVVGNPEKQPSFLASGGYLLGLIDVETAIDVDTSGNRKIAQPPLGGTPFYATPSHLMTNKLLKNVFNDLSGILQLQDWHAAVVMIYYVITGGRLFKQTARLIPSIKNIIIASFNKKEQSSGIPKNISRMFWRSAFTEFNEKKRKKEKMLRAVDVIISKNAAEMLKAELIRENKKIFKTIEKYVNSQTIFKSSENRQNLIQASHQKICQMKDDWENADNIKNRSQNREQITKLLKNLAFFKERSRQYENTIQLLSHNSPKLSAYDLINCMFNIVFKSMYKESWGSLQ